jgi:hypothetical protein
MSLKKDSAEAVDSLQAYLRRDKPAMDLLATVARYIGTLRREASISKERIAALEAENAIIKEMVDSSRIKEREAKENERQATDGLRQVKSDLHRLQVQLAEIHAKMEPAVRKLPADCPPKFVFDARNIERIGRKLIKRFNQAPGTLSQDIGDYLNTYSSEEFENIGMMICYSTAMGMPVRFVCEKLVYAKEKDCIRFLKWIRGWLKDSSKIEKQIMDHAISADVDLAYRTCQEQSVQRSRSQGYVGF